MDNILPVIFDYLSFLMFYTSIKIKTKNFLSLTLNVATMKISIDTKEDSHDEIKKVIKMLQNLVGETQEIFTNEPSASTETSTSPFANIFGDTSSSGTQSTTAETQETTQEAQAGTEASESTQSTEDLFAELFSEEELKKMDTSPAKEDEEEEIKVKQKDKGYKIEFY